MKCFHNKAFPVFFALFAMLISAWRQGGFTLITWLVFFGALGWSAMSCLTKSSQLLWRNIYPIVAATGSILLVEWLLPPARNRFSFRVVYLVMIGGMLGIHLYLRLSARREDLGKEQLD